MATSYYPEKSKKMDLSLTIFRSLTVGFLYEWKGGCFGSGVITSDRAKIGRKRTKERAMPTLNQLIRHGREEKRRILRRWSVSGVCFLCVGALVAPLYFMSLKVGLGGLFHAVLQKLMVSIGMRAIAALFVKMGCSVGLTLAIGFAVKAILATEGTPSMGNNMMAPAGGEGGSGAGSSQRPVHLDLTLPPGGRDELSAVMDDLAEAESGIQQALLEIERLNESKGEVLQANLEARERELARLRTFLSEVDERVEQARSMDSARDQERARLRAELRAQIEPFRQTEARLAAQRQALEEVQNSLQQQLRAQNQFLQEAGEGSTSAPVLKEGTPLFKQK